MAEPVNTIDELTRLIEEQSAFLQSLPAAELLTAGQYLEMQEVAANLMTLMEDVLLDQHAAMVAEDDTESESSESDGEEFDGEEFDDDEFDDDEFELPINIIEEDMDVNFRYYHGESATWN